MFNTFFFTWQVLPKMVSHQDLPEHPACPDRRTTIRQNPMTSQRSLIINTQVHYIDKRIGMKYVTLRNHSWESLPPLVCRSIQCLIPNSLSLSVNHVFTHTEWKRERERELLTIQCRSYLPLGEWVYMYKRLLLKIPVFRKHWERKIYMPDYWLDWMQTDA